MAVFAALGLAACGSDTGSDASGAAAPSDLPTIVVTTNFLGDVVGEIVGDSAEVVTIMPVGADPHDFQASAQQVDTMVNADALIVNGAAFEEGLLDVIENAEAEGVPTFEAISAVTTIEFGEGGHSDEEGGHSDEEEAEHAGEEEGEHSDEGGEHGHSGADPHFFTDPTQMSAAVGGIVAFLQEKIEFADPSAIQAGADDYISQLAVLDAEVEEMLTAVPDEQRVLVTNHEVFGYFADRYDFEVVGTVIPSLGTSDSASAGELAELAELITAEGVPAIFADTSSTDELVKTLADEVGGEIAVIELFSESLGEEGSGGATYVEMVRTNAERISGALA